MSDEYWYEPEFRDEYDYGEKFGPVYKPPKPVASLAIGTRVCDANCKLHKIELVACDNGCIYVLGETDGCRRANWHEGIQRDHCRDGRRRIDPAEAERIMDALRRDIDGFREKIPKP